MEFGAVLLDLFFKPAAYDAAKLGTGQIWKQVSAAYNDKRLNSLDIELYHLVEEACTKEGGTHVSVDDRAAACEILCRALLTFGYFEENRVQEALRKMKSRSTANDAARFKMELESRLNGRMNCALAALRITVEDTSREVHKLSKGTQPQPAPVSAPIKSGEDFSVKDLSAFAQDCLAETVFDVQKLDKGSRIKISFEPCRIRQTIPGFAGVYYRCSRPLDITGKNRIHISVDFKDERLKGIRLELKKAEHTRPEDEYKLKIENKGIGRKEYDFALDSCPAEIKRQLGEIVLAVYVNDFTDMNNLTADIELREWYFHTEETAV